MRIAAKLLCAAAIAAFCAAQTTQPQTTQPQKREVTMLEGQGELLTFKSDVTKVAISEPKIADAVVISPREVMVNGKAPGRATLMVWESAEPTRWEVHITRDSSEWDAFLSSMHEAAGAPISITGSGETIVLSGKVRSA